MAKHILDRAVIQNNSGHPLATVRVPASLAPWHARQVYVHLGSQLTDSMWVCLTATRLVWALSLTPKRSSRVANEQSLPALYITFMSYWCHVHCWPWHLCYHLVSYISQPLSLASLSLPKSPRFTFMRLSSSRPHILGVHIPFHWVGRSYSHSNGIRSKKALPQKDNVKPDLTNR